MKAAFISFVSVFIVSLIFLSIAEETGWLEKPLPYPYPAGIKAPVEECHHGTKRDDFGYSEINVVDQARPIYMMSDISQDGDRNSEFPTGANN